MNMNRSSYIKWFKNKNTKNQYQVHREAVYPLIQECHERHASYGYHMIAAYMREHSDWNGSDHLVHKCCKFLGIKSKIKHYKYTHKDIGEEHMVFDNVIHNDWSTETPLEKISSDMTCMKYRGTLYDVVLYLDAFNNEILSYAYINQHNSSIPYYEGLEKLLIKLKGIETQTILHTDQGSTYSSKVYNHTYKDYNIMRSMSRAGTPTDNPIIESMNGWMKAEIDCDWDIDSYETFDQFIEEYIYYYNHQRYAYSLNYKTPVQYRIDLGF